MLSDPPSIARTNATKLQNLRCGVFVLSGNAAGCCTTDGKGWPAATRPCRQDGTTVLLVVAAVAATARRALTRSDADPASILAAGYCSRRAMEAWQTILYVNGITRESGKKYECMSLLNTPPPKANSTRNKILISFFLASCRAFILLLFLSHSEYPRIYHNASSRTFLWFWWLAAARRVGL